MAQELETMLQGGDRAIGSTVDLTLAVDHFYIFAVCLSFSSRAVAITQQFKQLITASNACLYQTLHRLAVMGPTSIDLNDIRRRYNNVLTGGVNFTDLPSHHTMIMIDALIRRDWGPHPIWRNDDRPSDQEHVPFVQDIAKLALAEYRRERGVPKWIVDFAFNSLSLDPLPSASIVANCFEIIATNLGYDIPDATNLDERYIFLVPFMSTF